MMTTTSINDLTVKQIAVIKRRIQAGEFQHVIASDFNVNQGRINEIARGKRFAEINPARFAVKKGKQPVRKILTFKKPT